MMVLTRAVTFVLVLSCSSLVAKGAGSGQQFKAQANVAEQYLQAAADQERSELHLPPLRRDAALVAAARGHALQMISHGSISHQFAGEPDLAARGAEAGARFSLISENVAESTSALQIHSAWMRSEGHRYNLLDPNVDAVGIAVIARGPRLFAVEDFERTIAALTLKQQEGKVAEAIAAIGISVKDEAHEAARRVCASDSANEGRAAFVMRYTTSQLEVVPNQLRTRIASGKYGSATVAACQEPGNSSFSMYRIAVLIYR